MYTRDTPDIIAVGWEGRLVLWELIRKVDRSGVIEIGLNDDDLLADLLRIPVAIMKLGISKLLNRGTIQRTDHAVVLINFVQAQETRSSDRERQERSRSTRRSQHVIGSSPDKNPGDSCHLSQTEVTAVTKRREEKRIEDTTDDLSHNDLHAGLPPGEVVGSQLAQKPDPEPEAAKKTKRAKVPQETLEAVYGLYPRKEGKKAGLKALERILSQNRDPLSELRDIALAIKNYNAIIAREGRDLTKVKHFSTFINNWTDYKLENLEAQLLSSKPSLPPPIPVPTAPISDGDREANARAAQEILANLTNRLRILK